MVPASNGCNEVVRAAHMHTFSSCPYFGIVYYLYMFGLTALFAFDPFERALRLAALHYAAIGVCFSIYSMYLQLTFIHAFCIYCFISAVIKLLLLIAAVSHFRIIESVEATDLEIEMHRRYNNGPSNILYRRIKTALPLG